jgi:hypothetical protein
VIQPFKIALDLDEVEYIQHALEVYMNVQATMAQRDNEVVTSDDENGFIVDLSDMFSAQYVDARNLLKRFIDLVGRNLTDEGQ